MLRVDFSQMACIALLGIAVFVATDSGAAAQTVYGAGLISCGEWLRLRSFDDREDHFRELASLYQAQAWVDGFLSGLNSTIDPGAAKGPDLLARHDEAGWYAWIDNYCRSKPLDYVVGAVVALAKYLRSESK